LYSAKPIKNKKLTLLTLNHPNHNTGKQA